MRSKLIATFFARLSRKWLVVIAVLCFVGVASAAMLPQLLEFLDPTGVIATYNVNGRSDTSNPFFFQVLGTNGRSCATCHVLQNGFGLSAAHVERFYKRHPGPRPALCHI